MVKVTDTDTEEVIWVWFDGSRVTLEIASKVFALMKEREHEHLGALIGEAYMGAELRPRRRVNGKANGHARG